MNGQPVPAWRHEPNWPCAECHERATGTIEVPGVVIFTCSDHRSRLSDAFIYELDYGGTSGYSILRYSWRRSLSNLRWRVTHRFRYVSKKKKQEQRENDVKMDQIFGTDPPRHELVARIKSA